MSAGRRAEMRRYVAGFGLSLALTGLAFAAVHWQAFDATGTLGGVFALAFAQVLVHFRCFLQIGVRRSARDEILLILFSAVIIALMVSGTLVLLFNLRARMM